MSMSVDFSVMMDSCPFTVDDGLSSFASASIISHPGPECLIVPCEQVKEFRAIHFPENLTCLSFFFPCGFGSVGYGYGSFHFLTSESFSIAIGWILVLVNLFFLRVSEVPECLFFLFGSHLPERFFPL